MTSREDSFLTNRERVATCCICCGSKALSKSPAILMPFVAHRIFNWQPVKIDHSWGLNTIQSGTAYAICNSTLCSVCGLLFLDMRFSDNELRSLYDGYKNEAYTELREKYEPGYKQLYERMAGVGGVKTYLDKVEEFLMPLLSLPARILDWGGDTGENSPFKNCNKMLDIYDISQKKPASYARAVDKDVAQHTDYDLIVCSQTLEHIPFPSEMLVEIKKAMRKETILYIEVPYEEIMRTYLDDKNIHTRKKHWHEHINFFSEKSLKMLLNNCGLEIVSFRLLLLPEAPSNGSHLFQIACKSITL